MNVKITIILIPGFIGSFNNVATCVPVTEYTFNVV